MEAGPALRPGRRARPRRAGLGEAQYSRSAARERRTPNKKVIETYFAGNDRSKVAPLLHDDVEWVEWGDGVPPGGARLRGKAAYLGNFGDDRLETTVLRMVEENNVVVAEGVVRVHKKDGTQLRVQFCDLFELDHGLITRLSSFGALLKDTP